MKKRGLPPKPAKGRNEEEEEEEYNPQKKFILPINFQKPKAGDEYEPLGRGPVERYPKRLRIPPLRFW